MLALWNLLGCMGGGAPVVSVVPNATPVDVADVREGELDETWLLPGMVQPSQHAVVAAQVPGELREVLVRPGDLVEEAAPLARIDDALIKAQVEAARAEVDEARGIASAHRSAAGELGNLGTSEASLAARVSGAKAGEFDARARARRAFLETLTVQLVRHEVRAPFRGMVADRFVDVGDTVYTGDAVVEIVSLGEVEIELRAPGAVIGTLEPGQAATIEGSDDTLVGEILAVVPVVDPETGTAVIRVRPGEPRPWLIAGAEVGVRLPLVRNTVGSVVPKEAVLRKPSGTWVMRVVDSRAVPVKVAVMARSEDEVLVAAGALDLGDRVVVAGADGLRSGQLLRVSGEE